MCSNLVMYLQIRLLNLSMVKELTQGHTAVKQLSESLYPLTPGSKSYPRFLRLLYTAVMADNYQSPNPRQFLYPNTKAYQDSIIKTVMDLIIFPFDLTHHLETEHREQLGQGSTALHRGFQNS